MKYLFAALALAFTFSVSAQTGLVEFPYNPDANGDDIIGVTDVLELLGLFGSEFAEENLYLDADSVLALYHASTSTYYHECFKSCSDLPGNWRIPEAKDFYHFELTSFDQGVAWLNTLPPTMEANMSNWTDNRFLIYVGYSGSGASNNGRISFVGQENMRNCYCATHERPKVEYSYCYGSSIQSCANAKVADGWYPLSGISSHQNGGGSTSGSYQLVYQAFWRWAE